MSNVLLHLGGHGVNYKTIPYWRKTIDASLQYHETAENLLTIFSDQSKLSSIYDNSDELTQKKTRKFLRIIMQRPLKDSQLVNVASIAEAFYKDLEIFSLLKILFKGKNQAINCGLQILEDRIDLAYQKGLLDIKEILIKVSDLASEFRLFGDIVKRFPWKKIAHYIFFINTNIFNEKKKENSFSANLFFSALFGDNLEYKHHQLSGSVQGFAIFFDSLIDELFSLKWAAKIEDILQSCEIVYERTLYEFEKNEIKIHILSPSFYKSIVSLVNLNNIDCLKFALEVLDSTLELEDKGNRIQQLELFHLLLDCTVMMGAKENVNHIIKTLFDMFRCCFNQIEKINEIHQSFCHKILKYLIIKVSEDNDASLNFLVLVLRTLHDCHALNLIDSQDHFAILTNLFEINLNLTFVNGNEYVFDLLDHHLSLLTLPILKFKVYISDEKILNWNFQRNKVLYLWIEYLECSGNQFYGEYAKKLRIRGEFQVMTVDMHNTIYKICGGFVNKMAKLFKDLENISISHTPDKNKIAPITSDILKPLSEIIDKLQLKKFDFIILDPIIMSIDICFPDKHTIMITNEAFQCCRHLLGRWIETLEQEHENSNIIFKGLKNRIFLVEKYERNFSIQFKVIQKLIIEKSKFETLQISYSKFLKNVENLIDEFSLVNFLTEFNPYDTDIIIIILKNAEISDSILSDILKIWETKLRNSPLVTHKRHADFIKNEILMLQNT